MELNFTLNEAQTQQRDTFVERLLTSSRGVFDIFGVYIGDRLGFYRALADGAWRTSAELATQTHTHERYVREWLEQQTVMGVIEIADANANIAQRHFRLPLAHAEPLVAETSLNYMAPLAQLLVGATRPLDLLLRAYRYGGGVPYHEFGRDFREGQANINRPAFLKQLGTEWLPMMPDIHARLQQAQPTARIADIGCGLGWSSIGMAQAYPQAQVDGFDLDEPSIASARQNAAQAGLSERVKFHVRDAADPLLVGRYDLVTALECVHDMSNPIGALRMMRQLTSERGAVFIADERVGDAFTPTGNDVEWMMYGWSVLHCLPVGMADQPSAGTGTVMRADTLHDYAREAGFRKMEVLPIENFFFRFYRLTP